VGISSEQNKEPSGFTNLMEYLNQTSNYQLYSSQYSGDRIRPCDKHCLSVGSASRSDRFNQTNSFVNFNAVACEKKKSVVLALKKWSL